LGVFREFRELEHEARLVTMLDTDILSQFSEVQQSEAKKYLEWMGVIPGDSILYIAYPSKETRKLYPEAKEKTKRVKFPELAIDTILYQQKYLEQQISFSVAVYPGILRAGTYERKNENVKAIRAIWCECDDETITPTQQIELLNQFDPKPFMLVFTGGKSVHAYWIPSDRYFTPDEFDRCQRGLIAEYERLGVSLNLKADHSMTALNRCMRLPGTYHASGEMCTIIQTGEKYPIDVLLNQFGIIPETTVKPVKETRKSTKTQSKNKPENDGAVYSFSQNFWLLIERSGFKFTDLISQANRDKLEALNNLTDETRGNIDCSEFWTTIAKDFVGWQNTIESLFNLNEHQLELFDAEKQWSDLAFDFYGDEGKCERIWQSIDAGNCQPAILVHKQEHYAFWMFLKTIVRESGCYSTRDVGDQPLIEYIQHYFTEIFDIPKEDCLYYNDRFYLNDGSRWQQCDDGYFMGKIQHFAAKLVDITIKDKTGLISYHKPIRTNYAVKDCLNALKALHTLQVDSDFVFIADRLPLPLSNVPALNLSNGVLTLIDPDGKRDANLVEYHRDYGFKSISPVPWNPEASTAIADKMMEAFRVEAHKNVFLGALAASLDWLGYNAKIGRPKALIALGEGANGKDSLRKCFSHLLPEFGNFSLDLFGEQSQTNKTFGLSDIGQHSLSWVSENTSHVNFSNLKSLIAAITGDDIKVEQKYKDHVKVTPKCLFIFHANRSFVLDGNEKMIRSRLFFLDMPYTYSAEPDQENPMDRLADSRLHGDRAYQIEQVCPGLLVRLVAAYQKIWSPKPIVSVSSDSNQTHTESEIDVTPVGIDWHGADPTFDRVVRDNNHLFTFLEENGCVVTGVQTDIIQLKCLFWLYNEWLVSLDIAYKDNYSGRYTIGHNSQPKYDKYLTNIKSFSISLSKAFSRLKLAKSTRNDDTKNRQMITGLKCPPALIENYESIYGNKEDKF
jgi:hypothetical protein